jgi:hypothetical protein
MTNYSVEVRNFLNRCAPGVMSPNATCAGFLTPEALELAVAHFCAYEIYQYESLALLDSFTCTGVSTWRTLENDGVLEGSATISATNAGSPVAFQTPRFTWMPLDANGNPIPSNYAAASGGDMQIVTHSNVLIDVQTTVVGYQGYNKVIQEVPQPYSPSPSAPNYDDPGTATG